MSKSAMYKIATFLIAAAALLGADSSWTRVKELKSRVELRIYKKGAREPITATFDDANDERLIVVVKNEQVAIPKEDIDRLDARAAAPQKLNVEKTEKLTDPDPVPNPRTGPARPGESTSSNVSFGGSKPDFETIYRRTASAASAK
jgi:hypothetical protein